MVAFHAGRDNRVAPTCVDRKTMFDRSDGFEELIFEPRANEVNSSIEYGASERPRGGIIGTFDPCTEAAVVACNSSTGRTRSSVARSLGWISKIDNPRTTLRPIPRPNPSPRANRKATPLKRLLFAANSFVFRPPLCENDGVSTSGSTNVG